MWKKTCESLGLDMPQAFKDATDAEIDADYNGIGPDQMPDFIASYLKKLDVPASEIAALAALARKAATDIFSEFQPAAVIHDYEFTHSDKTEAGFHAANDRLLANCKRIVNQKYPWGCYFTPWTGTWKKRAAGIATAEFLYYACEKYGLQAWRD